MKKKEKFTVIDLINLKEEIKHHKIPQGLITKDGKMYCVEDGNHLKLYTLMLENNIDVEGVVRYGFFFDEKLRYRKQYLANLKEYEELGLPKMIKLTNKQAQAIDNLRVCFNYDLSLQNFLIYRTADFGFSQKDYVCKEENSEAYLMDVRSVFKWNFLTFEEVISKHPSRDSHLDLSEMYKEKMFIR